MAHLQIHHACSILKISSNFRIADSNSSTRKKRESFSDQTVNICGWKYTFRTQRRELPLQVTSSSSQSVEQEKIEVAESRDFDSISTKDGNGFVQSEHGWQIRRMIESEQEMRMVARIQAEAFHQPVVLFNDMFLEFFQAEVLSGLVYRLKNSPPNRYACLVAVPSMDASGTGIQELVGVVDITVLRDNETMQYLEGAEEYLYVSGIAVSRKFRRQKVATALLGACDKLAALWGFDYLALRAYEDDLGAQTLYKNAGYAVVGKDPEWMTTWIGRKRRVLFIKRSNKDMFTCETLKQTEA